MAYVTDMEAAAHRHYVDGRKLLAEKCYDNAGYHFGLSAECAIKQKLVSCGLQTDEVALWKHWPDLKPLALMAVTSRQAAPIRALLQRGSFMQAWAIVMRYSSNGSVGEDQAARWQTDANDALGLLI